ncbi:MAG: hypothetical protein M3467_05235 [Actinomycetota bacterium]|nr:hypothetical protein [Actinomycetota bacterium]MDQ3431612.1 hypothetical protein [Actinomycetota bacterium]
MYAVLWVLIGLSQLIMEIRRLGQAGRDRFRRLDQRWACAVHDLYVGQAYPVVNGGGIALSVLGVVLAAADGRCCEWRCKA